MLSLFQINVVANQGSTGKIAEQIGVLAKIKGWESSLAYGRGNPKSELELFRISNRIDVMMHALQTRLFDRHGLASISTTKKLIKRIEAIKPNIIHLHNIHGYYLNYELLFEFLAFYNKPVVWTLHDCWPFTGHCAFFDYPKCDKWKTHCDNCPAKRAYPSSLFLDRSKKNFDDKRKSFLKPKKLILVPVSEWLNGLLKESFLADVPSTVIHNGIDLRVFSENKLQEIDRESFHIISVANNWSEPRKGLKDILALREILPPEYKITVVGVKDDEKKRLPPGVLGITNISNQKELALLYASSDVFILPTYEDNYPTVILESLASGTPVITYNTGGCSEAINEQVGFSVPKGDIRALASAIKSIKENPISKDRCREWAIERFDNMKCFEAYFELYNSLLVNEI